MDQETWNALCRRAGMIVHKGARRQIIEPEDLLQDALIDLWIHDRLDHADNSAGYIFGTMRYKYFSLLRTNINRLQRGIGNFLSLQSELAEDTTGEDILADPLDLEYEIVLRDFLRHLSESRAGQAAILSGQGYSYQEIADHYGTTVNYVNKIMRSLKWDGERFIRMCVHCGTRQVTENHSECDYCRERRRDRAKRLRESRKENAA